MSEMLLNTLKEYLMNSSLHGLRFIATEDRHWTERVFWIACVILSWYGSGLLILSSWDAFQTNAISFVVESTYNDWDTAFPSYTVCEVSNSARAIAAVVRHWGNVSDSTQEEIMSHIAFHRGAFYFITQFCFNGDQLDTEFNCPQTGLLNISDEVHSPCKGVFHRCSWRDKEFDCCKYFRPLITEFGKCYSINNMNAGESYKAFSWLDMVSNHSIGPGTLHLELKTPAMGYLTSRQEPPQINTPTALTLKMEMGSFSHSWITVKEVVNAAEVREVSAEQRKCRFPDENDLNVYDKYSFGGCIAQCHKEFQVKNCGCASHLTPGAKVHERCNLTGFLCLNRIQPVLSVMKNAWSTKPGLYCPCMDTCDNMELSVLHSENMKLEQEGAANTSVCKLTLYQLPTERFKRIVVRGKLDLVVSMGGTTALFVGASLLSFVELIYYFTMRLYGNIYNTKNAESGRSTLKN